MNNKSLFSRFVLFLIVTLLLINIFIPLQYNFQYPAKLGPEFNVGVKNEHLEKINKIDPDLILIGDSTLEEGIDADLLSENLGIRTYKAAIPGSGTTSWYLFMKNIVFEAKRHPKYVAVLFRVTMLTVPQYRTTGKYFFLLDDYAQKNEPLVSELTFINQMSPFERLAQQYLPVYTARVDIREDLDNALRYRFPSMLAGCDRACTDNAVGSIFGREVDPVALNLAQDDAAKTLYDPKEMNFNQQLSTSLLPYMIELMQKNNSTLILIRTKIYGPETQALEEYTKALDAYLVQQDNIILLDYSNDPRILKSYYADTLHMNPYGKYEFTNILAADIQNRIK